jgi:16S rRNA processing protein RimM
MPFVRVGWALAPFGVHGFLKFAYSTDHPEWITSRSSYLLSDPRSGECLEMRAAEVELRPENFVVRFAGYDTPELLEAFKGWDLGYSVKRGELPREEADDVYLFELQGLEVRDASGAVLGRVADVLDSGAHTILQLDAAGEPLMPFLKVHVPEVNLAEGYLVTTYPFPGRS